MEQNPAYKHSYISAYSSVVEQWPSKPSVSGSNPLKRNLYLIKNNGTFTGFLSVLEEALIHFYLVRST